LARRGVVWSIDVVIGLVVFAAAIVAFFILTSSRQAESPKDVLADENRAIVNALETSQELSILYLGELSTERVQALAAMNYTDLKARLGLVKDFCILFQDAEGNLLNISGVRTIGDPRINNSYEGMLHPCGT
jgi:hypothetical protein